MEEKMMYVDTTTLGLGGTQSPGLKNLFTAMAKAQAQLETASRDKDNPFFKSKYADLGEVWKACRTALTSNGISVLQFPIHSEDGKVHLETILAHSSGESISRTFSVPVVKQDAQTYGAAITYLRRFSLASVVGVVSEIDDDGATASGTTKPGIGVHKPTEGAKQTLSNAQIEITERLFGTIVDCFDAGNVELAHQAIETAALEPEMKVYLWGMLDSKQRAALKRVKQISPLNA
jgi:hypothetical protein